MFCFFFFKKLHVPHPLGYQMQGWIKWFLPQEQGFNMKISSLDFLTQIDVLTINVQNIVTSHMYIKLLQSCISPTVQRCYPLLTKFNFDFIFTLTQLLYYKILQNEHFWISTPFLLFSSFFISFSSSLFSSSSYPNYTCCDDFLNIPWYFPPFLLLLLFIPVLFFLPFPIQRSLFPFFSFLLRLFSSHLHILPHFCCFNFNPVFPIH